MAPAAEPDGETPRWTSMNSIIPARFWARTSTPCGGRARPPSPQQGLARGQGPHGGRWPGSQVRPAPLRDEWERPGDRPTATRPRQHQIYDHLCEGDQGGQDPGGECACESLPEPATEWDNWCELGPAPTWKSRSSAGICCESLTHFPSTTEFLAPAWPTQ